MQSLQLSITVPSLQSWHCSNCMHLESICCCWEKKLKYLPKNAPIVWSFKIVWNLATYETSPCTSNSLSSDKPQTRIYYPTEKWVVNTYSHTKKFWTVCYQIDQSNLAHLSEASILCKSIIMREHSRLFVVPLYNTLMQKMLNSLLWPLIDCSQFCKKPK